MGSFHSVGLGRTYAFAFLTTYHVMLMVAIGEHTLITADADEPEGTSVGDSFPAFFPLRVRAADLPLVATPPHLLGHKV